MGIVYGDEFGAVGKSRFHLHVVDHFGHAFHYVFALEKRGAVTHEVGDVPSITRALDDLIG